ncbi:MAG: hypothetical protein JRC99_12445 [Deltaproteobacteria bacterium]|nr:hypothetical protein [Deltaproteobacteria bacterium]
MGFLQDMTGREKKEVGGKLIASQMSQTERLMDEITSTIEMVHGAKKLGVEKRASILSKLVKAHSDLVKTQRTMLGLDHATTNVTAGVIIIPGKSDNWKADAEKEIENAHDLIKLSAEDSKSEEHIEDGAHDPENGAQDTPIPD